MLLMKNNFFKKCLALSALFAFMCFSPHGLLRAQSIANYSFSTSTTGTLEDLSVGSTSLLTGNQDDVATTVNALGFNFGFMGGAYSHFSANSNGQVLLHTSGTAPAISGSSVSAPAASTPYLFLMAGDNEVNDGMRYKVIGTAPNRIFVLEWTQFYAQWTNITNAGNMQLWLHEGSGVIEYVYGEIYNSSSSSVTRSIGLSSSNTATTAGYVTVSATPTFTPSATFTTNTFAANTGGTTATPLIANLGSNAQGSRRIYTFTPAAAPVAPTALSFTAVTATGMTLNWTDNASNELGYRIYRSTDNVNFTSAGQVAANVVTYPATGLAAGTLYYWRVVSFVEIESLPATGTQSTNTPSFSGIKTVGAGGDYQNLTTAFADINSQALSGNVELQLISGYPAAPETYPILSCNGVSTGIFTVKVYPTVSGLSITSANATGTLNLNGASNLTFDGRVNQTGAADMVISNTNAGASYAVQFVNDAKTNTLQYITIHSANNSATSGTIVFAGSTGTTGNDNNLIDNCDIRDGATTPLNAIYSAGTSVTVDNSGNTISNSNIYNYFGAATASNGILLASNSAAWTINANKFYQTSTRTLTGGSQHRGINIITSNGNGYVITNNIIGYATSTGTGVTTYNGAFAGRFFGIELTASNTGTASSIQGNTVSGISLTTTSGATAAPGVFAGISILGGTVNVGNTTPNIIGASTGNGAISISNSTSANIFGIHANSTGTLNVSNNVIGAINGAGSAPAVVCGMTAINNTGSSTATTISGNTIGGPSANSIAIGTMGVSTGSAVFSGISSTGSHTTFTASGNTINNVSNYHNNTSSTFNGIISSSGSPTTMIVNNNTISNVLLAAGVLVNIDGGGSTTLTANTNTIFNASVTGASGTIYGIRAGTTQFTWNNNTIHDLAITANSGTGASIIYGMYNLASPTVENITNNQVYNLSIAGATTSTSNIIMGIHTNTTTSTKVFSGNTVNGLSFTNSSTGTSVINGISSALGTTVSIFKNKVYNLSSSGAGSTVNGLLISSSSFGTSTGNVYNNIIGDLKAPTASAAGDVVRGISITSTSATATYRVYYNSIYLNASSTGTNFSTSGIYHAANGTATTAALDLRNNIIINESTPAGTGISAAFRRSSAALANFASTSNRNMLYAGAPSATRLIMYDGTNSYQTMPAYQAAVSAREVNSFSGEATFTGVGYGTAGNFFISTTPSSTDYLKPVAGIATQAESGGVNITTPAITDDYSAVIRQGNAGYTGTGTAPDLGAFEFEGQPLAPPSVAFNSITPNTQQCVATARLVSVNVTNTFGSVSGVVINYSINGTAQTPIAMSNTSGVIWEGTIPAPTPGNATIAWSVTATNTVGLSGSFNGTPYSDEPLTGIAISANASSTAICIGSSSTLTATLTQAGTVAIGSGSTTTTSVAENPFYGGYGGVKTQYLVRASELTAQGLSAGNITQLSLNITTAGSALSGFGISVSTTALTALTGNIENVGNQVYSTASFVPVVGANNFVFSTPLNWDGTSNIILSFCWSNNNTSNTASQIMGGTTPFVSANARYVDNKTSAEVCGYTGNTTPGGWNGGSTTASFRPNFVFTGNKTPAIQTISWSDGVTTVGTTNSLIVSPTATTTYTATITAANCSVSPSPSVTVTVNPLPAAPTATNSAHCGTQVPTASVTSTSGLPTPAFKWYDAASAGNVLQNSASTTYTTAISTTTTLYVSEVNTVTGCESARVPVTITVSASPAVSVSGTATICNGSATALTASSSNDPNYTYTWSDGLGTGATVSASPTSSTTYTVTATDASGGANNGCVTSATYAITVNPVPTAVIAGVNDAIICNGEIVNLTSSATSNSQIVPVTVLTQNFNSGLGTWTTTASGTAPATAGFGIQNPPYTYTTYFNNFATPNGGGFAMSNADLTGSGNKIRTTLISPSFSTVGMTSANVTFENLYQKWNSGDSLVRLEISTNGGTTWSTLKDYLPLGSQGTVTSGAQVPVNENVSLASYLNEANLRIRFNYVTTYGYYWVIDNVVIGGLQPANATYSWSSVPAGFTSSVQNPAGVAPTVNTTYTVTTSNSYGCSASSSVAVTVNQPSGSSVSATACGTYTWTQNGMTYNTSGSYTDTVPNAVGCDSVITLNLTINTPTSATVNQTACQTYTWPINGMTYTTSGVYTATIPNAANCDSVITLNLTIGGPSASSVSVTECSSYTWAQNGMTYTASGAYTDTVVNMFGCDSVITLNLTINQPTTSTVTETECTSYTWAQNGMTYTASGMYNDTITNAAGCDSIITLDLTIIQPTTSTISVTECSSYTWAQNGMTYTASGMYTDTIPNSVNCDSVITLDLTINMPTSSVFTVSTCSPTYTWAQNGTVYNASGMYNDTILNAAGCDSVVTLNLTITNFVATATDNGDATITASAGTTYQWINCTTNTPIAGATAQTFAATANGSYAAIVSNGTCSDTSNCVNITNVGIKENMISTISVHPNPTNDVVIVTMDASSAIVEVMDVQGKLVQTTQIKSGDQVDLSTYERGVYTLRIKTESGTSIERIVKN